MNVILAVLFVLLFLLLVFISVFCQREPEDKHIDMYKGGKK
jgi:hypothetical protein